MKPFLRSMIVGALVFAGGTAFADDMTEPAAGTWKLNPTKSKFNPGPAPASQVRTYKATPEGTALSWKSVGADGKVMTVETTFKYDGKEYAVKGNPDFDTLALKRDDAQTVESTQKKGGKVIGHGTRTISKDGKTLTLSSKGISADGKAYEDVSVFDRQ